MKRWRTLSALVFCLASLVACASDAPADAARLWLQALLESDGATAMRLTCERERPRLQESGIVGAAFKVLLQAGGLDTEQLRADMSELSFETAGQRGDVATVHVWGNMYISVLDAPLVQQIDQDWTMVREGGNWRWCGGLAGASVAAEVDASLQPTIEPTATSEVSVRTPLDWRLVPVSFNKTDLGEGWSEISVKLAVENHSPVWSVIALYPKSGKVMTSEGYEYALNPFSIKGNSMTGFRVSPGFRIQGERKEGMPLRLTTRVATGSSGYTLILPYKIAVWEGVGVEGWDDAMGQARHFEIPLEDTFSGLSFPFINDMDWQAYRHRYSDQIRMLRPGEVLETEFGSITFDNLRLEPHQRFLAAPFFKIDVTVTNSSGGYGITPRLEGYVYTSEGYVTGMFNATGEGASSDPEWAEVGPKQTKVHTLLSWAQPEELGRLPRVVCLGLGTLDYWVSGEKQPSAVHQPVVICFP